MSADPALAPEVAALLRRDPAECLGPSFDIAHSQTSESVGSTRSKGVGTGRDTVIEPLNGLGWMLVLAQGGEVPPDRPGCVGEPDLLPVVEAVRVDEFVDVLVDEVPREWCAAGEIGEVEGDLRRQLRSNVQYVFEKMDLVGAVVDAEER